MSLDFQRMQSAGRSAYDYAGKTSITDRTSHRKGGVGCAAQVHGAWLGEQNLTVCVPQVPGSGYAADLRSATQGRAMFSTQFDHHALGQVAVSKETVQQVWSF